MCGSLEPFFLLLYTPHFGISQDSPRRRFKAYEGVSFPAGTDGGRFTFFSSVKTALDTLSLSSNGTDNCQRSCILEMCSHPFFEADTLQTGGFTAFSFPLSWVLFVDAAKRKSKNFSF